MNPAPCTGRRRGTVILMLLSALTPVLHAQHAINSIAPVTTNTILLPLRNLQIEVRQVRSDETGQAQVAASGAVDWGRGATTATLAATAQNRARAQASHIQQRVLVLNGRRASIALGNIVPLRLVQSWLQNGVWVRAVGTVLLEVGTGFVATPRWDGQDQVELELAAAQGSRADPTQSASTTTQLMLPLDQWVTVAQSETDTVDANPGLAGASAASQRASTQVQVRVSLP